MKPAMTILLVALSTISIFAKTTKEELARQAVTADVSAAESAIAELRAMGREGLDTLFTVYAADIERFSEGRERAENWDRIARAIDAVAMQKDAYASQLYWYTDLNEAKKAADSQHKPILSLRLLGNLNEEFSCANSRFFRSLLYSNSAISKYLRENYILHWKSVRPAPRVTIDFGDGRKIERTLTGNSIHYVLTEKGDIIDAIPGLYSPNAFLAYIAAGREVNKAVSGLPSLQRINALLQYRKSNFDHILEKRKGNMVAAKVALREPPVEGTRAIDVSRIAVTKMFIETPILTSIVDDFSRYEPSIQMGDWEKLASLSSPNNGIDAASVAFIERQNPGLGKSELDALLVKLNKYVSLDTTRNDFLLHPQLYSWLNRDPAFPLEALNARIYSSIFKTPDSDPWLGLYSTDIYTALDGNGVIR
jgi:hypothetical protein